MRICVFQTLSEGSGNVLRIVIAQCTVFACDANYHFSLSLSLAERQPTGCVQCLAWARSVTIKYHDGMLLVIVLPRHHTKALLSQHHSHAHIHSIMISYVYVVLQLQGD